MSSKSGIKHVEMYDGQNFCQQENHSYDIDQAAWHENPAAIEKATCTLCLRRIDALGAIAAKMRARADEGGGVAALRLSDREIRMLLDIIERDADRAQPRRFARVIAWLRRKPVKQLGTGTFAIYERLRVARESIA